MPADPQVVVSAALPHPPHLACASMTLLCRAMCPLQGWLDDPDVDVSGAHEVFCTPLVWRRTLLHSIRGASHLWVGRSNFQTGWMVNHATVSANSLFELRTGQPKQSHYAGLDYRCNPSLTMATPSAGDSQRFLQLTLSAECLLTTIPQ